MSITSVIQSQRGQLRAFMATNDRDWWYLGPLVALFAVGAIFDIWLVTHGYPSITKFVTDLCTSHTTVIALLWMVGLGLAELVQRYRWMVMTVWVLVGHLATGMGVC